jgi:hypothetical protein
VGVPVRAIRDPQVLDVAGWMEQMHRTPFAIAGYERVDQIGSCRVKRSSSMPPPHVELAVAQAGSPSQFAPRGSPPSMTLAT